LVRRVLVEGQSKAKVAAAFAVCRRQMGRALSGPGRPLWSLYPKRLHIQTRPRAVAQIETPSARWTGKQIAKEAGVSPAAVSRVLRRYEREHPVNASTSTSKNSGFQ
jgi:hypothetical protein